MLDFLNEREYNRFVSLLLIKFIKNALCSFSNRTQSVDHTNHQNPKITVHKCVVATSTRQPSLPVMRIRK
jgi:hypothetical protein